MSWQFAHTNRNNPDSYLYDPQDNLSESPVLENDYMSYAEQEKMTWTLFKLYTVHTVLGIFLS